MRGPVAMLNTEQQICGPSLVSNIEKNRSKKGRKDVNELSQHFYSSEIIIVSRISLFFFLGSHKWKVYAFNSSKLFDLRLLGANSQKGDNKEIKLHTFKVFVTLPMTS